MTLAEDLAFALDPTADPETLMEGSGLRDDELFTERFHTTLVPFTTLSSEKLSQLLSTSGLDHLYTEEDFAALLQDTAGLPARYLVVANPAMDMSLVELALGFRARKRERKNKLVQLAHAWGIHNPSAPTSTDWLLSANFMREIFFDDIFSQLPLSPYVKRLGIDTEGTTDVLSMILRLFLETNGSASVCMEFANFIREMGQEYGISGNEFTRGATLHALSVTQTSLNDIPRALRKVVDETEDLDLYDDDVAVALRDFFAKFYLYDGLEFEVFLGPLTFANALADEIGAPRPRHFLERLL